MRHAIKHPDQHLRASAMRYGAYAAWLSARLKAAVYGVLKNGFPPEPAKITANPDGSIEIFYRELGSVDCVSISGTVSV